MKSSIVFCALSFAIAAVEARPRDSNAHRLARGLPPLPPRRRQSGKRTTPSSTPFTCASKKTFCCADLTSTSSSAATTILSGLGVPLSSCGAHIGTGCVAAIGGSCDVLRESIRARWNRLHARCSLHVDLAHCVVFVVPPRVVGGLKLCLGQQLCVFCVGLSLVFGQQLFVSICVAFEQLRIRTQLLVRLEWLRVSICFTFEQFRVFRVRLSFVFGQQLFVRFACQQLRISICFAFEQLRVLGIGISLVFDQQLFIGFACQQLCVGIGICFAFRRRPQQLRIVRVDLSLVFGQQFLVGFACQQLRISICFAFEQLRVLGIGISLILVGPLNASSSSRVSSSASPSSTPVTCDTKKTFCCSDLASTSSSAATTILSGLGIPVSSCGAHIGTGCIAAIGESWYVASVFPLFASLFLFLGAA
ncbi:hypothetical protein DFH09DRAFT_1313868 [Mycena vulgaris]|nr:hypothetical protein DFH09DRAFT_1313868 [Mycena vulgaris]